MLAMKLYVWWMVRLITQVLLVDDDPDVLKITSLGLEQIDDDIKCITTTDPRKVLKILKEKKIDVLITDLKMPKIDGFELISRVGEEHPDLPCIVMTAHITPKIKTAFDDSISFIEKPFEYSHLYDLIVKAQKSWENVGQLQGISLSSFLQIIEMEKKTCRIDVFCKVCEKTGILRFVKGKLYSANYEKLTTEEAALKILSFHDVNITMKKQHAGIKKRITKPLMELQMEAMRLADEVKKINSPIGPSPTLDDLDEAFDRIEKKDIVDEVSGSQAKFKKEVIACLSKLLEDLKNTEDFKGAGVLIPTGELVGDKHLQKSKADVNDMLHAAARMCNSMGFGKIKTIHVVSDKINIFSSYISAGTDPLKVQPGKAHFSTVLLLSPNAITVRIMKRLKRFTESVAEILH